MKRSYGMILTMVVCLSLVCLARAEDEKPSAYLGVQISIPEEGGPITVQAVTDDSPAAKAGLKSGDTILKLDKKEYKDLNDLVSAITAHKPGDKVVLVIKRDGKEMEVTVTLAERPKQ